MVLASRTDFFLTGRQRDLTSGVHRYFELADRFQHTTPGAEPPEAGQSPWALTTQEVDQFLSHPRFSLG